MPFILQQLHYYVYKYHYLLNNTFISKQNLNVYWETYSIGIARKVRRSSCQALNLNFWFIFSNAANFLH